MDDTVISRAFSAEETREIADRLEMHDAIFSQLWQIGQQTFNSEIPTACVSFDQIGQVISLEVNPTFWEDLNWTRKIFIICHEMLHVILEHGRRAKDSKVQNRIANNVAMDVVVNELLVEGFGFKRKEVDKKNELCWIDTIFPDRDDILSYGTFEYYLNKLPVVKCVCGGAGKGKPCKCPGKFGGKVMDDHSKLPTDADIGDMLERAASKMSPEEREQTMQKMGQEGQATDSGQGQGRGTEGGNLVKVMSKERPPKKRKWETVIKKCLRKIASEGPEETWVVSRNRRMAGMFASKASLPTEVDGEGHDTKRALVYFFLDTSGSCSGLAPRFWKLAASVPRDVFDLRLRCFDTQVFEISMEEGKLFGFGGTSFDILEKHIQKEINGGRYPDGVFVVTDGYGNTVHPAQPKRWHVLNVTSAFGCFPKEINKYQLSEFE